MDKNGSWREVMLLSKYAKINRKMLLQALGYQKAPTYKYRQLDVKQSGCLSCPNKNYCENCSAKVYTNEVDFVYDRHQLGSQDTLKSIALKLYILFHFFNTIIVDEINGIGLIKNISKKYLAKMIGCNVKSIDNNLERLAAYGYISYSNAYSKAFCNIAILNYTNMFKPKKEGGYGYLDITNTILTKILAIDNLNDIRGLMQLLDETLSNEYTSYTKSAQTVVTFSRKKYNLPIYIRPGILQKAFLKFCDLFDFVELNEDYRGFIVCLKESSNPRRQKKAEEIENEKEINNHIGGIIDALSYAEADPAMAEIKLKKLGIQSSRPVPEMVTPLNTVFKKDISDMVQMSIQYGLTLVLEAFNSAYTLFIQNASCYENLPTRLGGLIRQIIRERNRFDFLIA